MRLCVIKCSEHIIKFPAHCDLEPGVSWHKWHGCQVSRVPSGPGERPDNLVSQSHQHTHTCMLDIMAYCENVFCIYAVPQHSLYLYRVLCVFALVYMCVCVYCQTCYKLSTKILHSTSKVRTLLGSDFIGWSLRFYRTQGCWGCCVSFMICQIWVFAEVLRALTPTSSELKKLRLRRETSSRTKPCAADHRDQAWDNNDLEEWEPTQTICILLGID